MYTVLPAGQALAKSEASEDISKSIQIVTLIGSLYTMQCALGRLEERMNLSYSSNRPSL